jgi:hypothetical protein
MSTASVTFLTDAYKPENQRDLTSVTLYASATGEAQSVIHPASFWINAKGARSAMETAMKDALDAGRGYPILEGTAMVQAMGWSEGLEGLLAARPRALRVTDSTNCLLPDLAPVTRPDGSVTWLDTQLPIYRTLQVDVRQVERLRNRSLAILFQDHPLFAALAGTIQRDLSDRFVVDTYPGSGLVPDASQRGTMLQSIFYRHQAVLFLGHLYRAPDGTGGWQLTARDWLPIRQLVDLLGGSRLAGPTPGTRRLGHGTPVPEVVFSICCSGAWGEPTTPGQLPIFYPEMFLNAGVRFYIGSWMDVILRDVRMDADLGVLHQLVCGFFTRWSRDQDHAGDHLYAAKEECGFHLLTGLYQLYALVEPAADLGRREPDSALVSGLARGDLLGDYVLDHEMWADPYARTFWASNAAHGNPALIQVLADEWQVNRDVISSLEGALQKLRGAGLSEGHLVPDRCEYVMWSRRARTIRDLHILVYDRPVDESPSQWSCLAKQPLDIEQPSHFKTVLSLGVQISVLLAELHAKGLLHGNLDPASIVLHRAKMEEHVLVKDAWVKQIRPGRTTNARYAAPEEPAESEGVDRLKYDCWGLGVILFELAVGQPFLGAIEAPKGALPNSIRAAIPAHEHLVPEALERVVRECLMPTSALRPASDLVAGRLLLAAVTDGAYVSAIEQEIVQHIQAGHRLLYVQTDDMRELEAVLMGMARHQHGGKTVHLYVAAEDIGLTDIRMGRNLVPWLGADLVQAQYGLRTPPTADEVAGFNGLRILESLVNMASPPPGELPIVLFRGAEWWDSIPQLSMLLSRLLKERQQGGGFPAVLVADSFVRLNSEVEPCFTVGVFPAPSPSELFERILAAPHAEHLDVPDLTAEEVIDLALALFPSSNREVTQALRMCAAQYGRLDENVLLIRDEERAQFFGQFETVTYLPISQCPDLDSIGLPPGLKAEVQAWASAKLADQPCPRRLMITSPPGCGKSSLAKVLAQCTQRPLVCLEATRCLRGRLGESEDTLRRALEAASSLAGAVVLLDDVDRFFGGPGMAGDASAVVPAMSRMSALLLNWLDALPDRLVAILTSADPGLLPPQWRRRVEMKLVLDVPILQHDPALFPASLTYRSDVFTALFYRFGLARLAADGELMSDLARGTDASMRQSPLPSPAALRSPGGPLASQVVWLRTGADIEHWISDMLYLHSDRRPPPEDPGFWRSAVR